MLINKFWRLSLIRLEGIANFYPGKTHYMFGESGKDRSR